MTNTGFSGKSPEDITVEAIRKGDVTVDDIRIHPDTLRHQAQTAAEHDNPQLAENFYRAAELTHFTDDEVMKMYEALRPGRSTQAELMEIAQHLAQHNAPRNAELFTQAADVYARRGFIQKN